MPHPTFPSPIAASADAGGAERVSRKPWVRYFLRFGQVVRGVIYGMLGMIALRLALGTRGEEMTQTGAIEMIGNQPFGRVLLVGVAIGLAGYALWGVIRAVFDPLHKGDSAIGLAKRFGFAASALGYAVLLFATIGIIVGSLPHVTDSGDWTAKLLTKPFGKWLVGLVALGWIATGSIEIARGWRARFVRDLDLGHRSAAERRWAKRLGRVGIMTRGIVFAIIGIFLIATAFNFAPRTEADMDGALLGLLRQPFGGTLLGAAGLGFIVFGVYSAMCARWMRTHSLRPEPR